MDLANGDLYSFDVTDASGCAHQVSGGPFIGTCRLPTQVLMPQVAHYLSFYLIHAKLWHTGTWSGGPVGTTFSPNANASNAVVTVPTDGTYTFTWTENNGASCTSTDDVVIVFSQMSIPAVVTGATCGVSDGEIVVAPQGGVPL
jgi:hypothetical protein